MNFIKNNGLRLLMLFLFLAACAGMVIYRQSLGTAVDQLAEDTAMTWKVASVCMKLFCALFLLYLVMLIMKELQDRKFIAAHPDEQLEKARQFQNGSFTFNIFAAVIVLLAYILLLVLKVFA